MKSNTLNRLTSLIVVLAGLQAVPRARAADPEFYYYYNGQKRALEIDDSQVAIKLTGRAEHPQAPTDNDAKSFARNALSLGIREEDSRSSRPGGWIMVGTQTLEPNLQNPVQKTTAQRRKELVQSLAARSDVDFAAPVFKDLKGKPVNLDISILVGFVSGTSEAAQAEILRKIRNVKSMRRVGVKGKWVVDTSHRNGFDLLDDANLLGGLPAVRYAEPNFIVTVEKL